MICIAVRMKKLSLSRAGQNRESQAITPKRMNTLSIKCEHADLEDSDISSSKGLVFETDN